MKIYILILCSLLTLLGYSQTPVKVWDKTLGGSSLDDLKSMISTTDGGYILAGYSGSNISGDKSENNKGISDYWVIKINSTGQKVWDKTFGGSNTEQLSSIIPTSDGGYILGGRSLSNISGDKSENSKGDYDYWIVKINSSGQKVWDKTYGGSKTDILNSITQTSDGGFALLGHSNSNISGDKSENSKGETDYWIVKINSSGQKEWDKTFGGILFDLFPVINSTSDGGYILAGFSESNMSGDKTENSRGSFDYWIVKINSLGQKEWDKTFGGSNGEILNSITQSLDGGYVLAGYSNSNVSGDKLENSRGGNDYWIVKINSSGQKEWDKTYGGGYSDYLTSITSTTDNTYVLAGYTNSNISGEKTEDSNGNDFWIIKINATGQKLWDKTLGGSGRDELKFILSTQDKSFLLGGSSDSNISGDKTENSKGSYDYWIVKVQEPCPTFSSAPANVSITNSTCSTNCTITNGSITAPTNACPAGSSIEYSTNNGVSWSSSLPVYTQTTPVSIQTRCKCLSDTSVVSTASVAVTTSPATCQLPNAPISGGNQSVFAINPIQTLTATATAPAGSTVKWYDAASAGNTVANPTWNIIGTKTYFAASKENITNCESATRTSVTLEIKARLSSDYVEFGVNNTHDPNVIFEVHSSNKGILFPRIDFNNRPTSNLTSGLLIYVILNGPQGNNCFYYWNGTSWVKL